MAQKSDNRMNVFIEKLKKLERRADEASRTKGWLYLLAVSVLSLTIALIPFMLRGTYTVWTGGEGVTCDAVAQGVTFLCHVRDYGWLKAIGSFDFYMGLGADYLTSLSFFSLFDPFNLVFFVLPFGDLMNYTLTMALKQLACACTVFLYLKHRNVRNSRAIVLSVSYMLTGFTAFTFVRHYNLTAGPIYLPLVLTGIEKILDGERPYLFVVSVFFSLITNFYVFFSISVFAVAYAIGYYFYVSAAKGERSNAKRFFARLTPVAGYYLLGVALGGAMLAPNAYGYLNAARSASKGVELFSFRTFVSQAISLTIPFPAPQYARLGLGLPVAVLAIYAVIKRDNSTRLHAWFTVALTIGYMLPLFGYAMNIFNYSNNRWSYGLSFFAFSLLGLQSKREETAFEEAETEKVNRFFVLYFAVLLITGLLALGEIFGFSAWLVLLAVLAALGTAFAVYKLIKSGVLKRAFRKFYEPTFLYFLSFVLTVTVCCGYYAVYSVQHDGAETYAAMFSAEEKYVSEKNKTEFFRTDAANPSVWFDSFENRGVNNAYYGTKAYNSITNKNVYEFLKENGVYNPTQNLGISGLDGRFALQSLLSVKYAYDPYGSCYGFEKTEGFDSLYENKNYVPFGFVLKESYSREYYLSLPVLERQNALLEGVVLEENSGTADGSFAPQGRVAASLPAGKAKKGEKVTVSAEIGAGEDVYFVLKSVKETGRNTRVNVTANGRTKQYFFAKNGDLMYSEQRTAYLSFGHCDEASVISFEAEIEAGREIEYEGIEIFALPSARAENAIERLKTGGSMQNVKTESNRVSGTVDSDGGYLVMSVPYSDGWTAYVDGEKTKLLQADTAFFAIEIESGTHEIVLEYETPFLRAGTIVSLCALVAGVVAVVAVELTRKHKRSCRKP